MSENTSNPVSISIDMKKYRIRIHKSTLHLLGDPPYILLLINPESRFVAIKSSDRPASDGLTHKVARYIFQSDASAEIYSHTLVKKLKELYPDLGAGNLYHMSGHVVPRENMAVFSMDTLTKI